MLTSQDQTGRILVTFPNGRQLNTEVADTPQKIFIGLAFRESIPQGEGILCIFPETGHHRLHTKGYAFPVDMIWLDESRYIVYLVENADPCRTDSCPFFGPPPKKVRYVIQTSAGFVKQQSLKVGEELKFTLKM